MSNNKVTEKSILGGNVISSCLLVFQYFNTKLFSMRKNECTFKKEMEGTAQKKVLCNCYGALLTGKGGYGKGKILSA